MDPFEGLASLIKYAIIIAVVIAVIGAIVLAFKGNFIITGSSLLCYFSQTLIFQRMTCACLYQRSHVL